MKETAGGRQTGAACLVGRTCLRLIATVLSDSPSLRLFGWISAFAMISALVADMLILRPTIMALPRLAMGVPEAG